MGTHGDTLRLVSREPTLLGQTLGIEAAGTLHKVVLPLIGEAEARARLASVIPS